MKSIAAAAFLAFALAAPGHSSEPAKSEGNEEARIAFPHRGAIRSFRAEGRDTLYLRVRGRQWYRATLMGSCPDLPFANSIGIDTRGSASLDRFSMVLVGQDRCPIQSLVKSDPPPRRRGQN